MTAAVSVRRSAVAVLAVTLPFAVACGGAPGPHGQTNEERATPYTAEADAGTIAVRGVRILPVTGADVGGYILAAIVNRGGTPDTLTNATVPGGAVTPSNITTLTVEPGRTLAFATPELDDTQPALQIGGLAEPLRVGTSVAVTFTFERAGTVRVVVPVKSASQIGTTSPTQQLDLNPNYPTPLELGE